MKKFMPKLYKQEDNSRFNLHAKSSIDYVIDMRKVMLVAMMALLIICLIIGVVMTLNNGSIPKALGLGNNDVTSTAIYLGKPFTKTNQYYNNVWDIQEYDGTLYFGHGDWAYNAGPIPLVSLDPTTDVFNTNVYSVDEESIWRFKVLDGKLYIPGSDAKSGGWGYGNFYVLEESGWRKYRTIPNSLHTLDMEYFDGKLWAGIGVDGGDSTKLRKYELQSSSDGGENWQTEMPESGYACYNRCNTLFHLNGNLYGVGYVYLANASVLEIPPGGSISTQNMTFSSLSSTGASYSNVMNRNVNYDGYLLYIVQSADPDVAVSGDGYHTPVAMVKANALTGGQIVTLPESGAVPTDILVRDNRVYVLASKKNTNTDWTSIVYYSSDLTNWTEAFHLTTGAMARSFEEIDRDFYIGLGGSSANNVKNANYGKIYKVPASLWAPHAQITSFTAPAGPVTSANNISLEAQVENVSSCELNNGIGQVTISGTLVNGVYADGSISLSAPAKPSYELTCTNLENDSVKKIVYTEVSDIQSNVANLSDISIAEGTIYPAFDPDVTSYTLRASVDVIGLDNSINALNVSYVKADTNSTVVVSGDSSLSVGKNTVSLAVTAQDGTTQKTYSIEVVRLPIINSLTIARNDAGAEVFSITPAFDPNNSNITYQTVATTSGSTFRITATSPDANTTVSIINSEGGKTVAATGSLSTGGYWTDRTVRVTTDDGISRDYPIRIRGLSNTTSLSAMTVKSSDNANTYTLTPAFASATLDYTLDVPNEITGLNITTTKTISYETVAIAGNTNLQEGDNNVTVTVTSEAGTTRVYTIVVTREPSTPPEKLDPALTDLDYTTPTNVTFDGSPKSIPTPTAKTGIVGMGTITVKYAGTSGTTYDETSTAPTNLGTYIVYADIAEGTNYNSAKLELGTFTIGKQFIDISGATVASKTYDNTTTATITAVSFSGLLGGDELELGTDYTVADAAFDSATAGTNKTVTATVTLLATAKTNNYTLTSGALSVGSQTIQKAGVAGVNQETAVKSEIADTYTFDLRTLLPSSITNSEVGSYSITTVVGDIYTVNPSINDYTLTLPVDSVLAGNAKSVITISFTSDNYDISNATVTVNVSARIPVEISGVLVSSKTYDGAPVAKSGEVTFKNSETQETISGLSADYSWKNNNNEVLPSAPTDAGSYKLVISADGGSDYRVTDLVIEFSIFKANQTIDFSCPSTANVGDNVIISATTSSGLVGIIFESKNPAIATITNDEATFIESGSVIIEASHNGNENYNSASADCTIIVTDINAPDYTIIQGFADFDGKGERKAIINADSVNFVKLMLDNNEIDVSYYYVENGSTIITLREEYLATLKSGSYEFIAVFSNGANVPLRIRILDTDKELIDVPNTGLGALMKKGGFLAIGLAAIALLAGSLGLNKIKINKKIRF